MLSRPTISAPLGSSEATGINSRQTEIATTSRFSTPLPADPSSNIDRTSLVLKISYQGQTFLLPADIYQNREEKLAKALSSYSVSTYSSVSEPATALPVRSDIVTAYEKFADAAELSLLVEQSPLYQIQYGDLQPIPSLHHLPVLRFLLSRQC